MDQFDYSSFFEDKKTISLGEVQQHFGFLVLSDLRKMVDEILAFEGVTQVVSKSTDTIVLTPKRIETILKGIQKWQLKDEEIIMKRSRKKGKSPEKKNSIQSLSGIRMIEVLSKCPQLSSAHWFHATKTYKGAWFFITAGSNSTDRVYCLREDFLDIFIQTYSGRKLSDGFKTNNPDIGQKITDLGKFLKNAKSI